MTEMGVLEVLVWDPGIYSTHLLSPLLYRGCGWGRMPMLTFLEEFTKSYQNITRVKWLISIVRRKVGSKWQGPHGVYT